METQKEYDMEPIIQRATDLGIMLECLHEPALKEASSDSVGDLSEGKRKICFY